MRASFALEFREVAMTRPRNASLLIVAIAVSAAAANAYFVEPQKPCFVSGAHAYRIAGAEDANVTVRVNEAAAQPNMRMQLVSDPATANFVLVDVGDSTAACHSVGAVKNIRLDADAAKPDLTVTLSDKAAPYKIYVHSAHYTPQDAAALFAVMRQDARAPKIAARD
jgi:hypothetical protein